MSAASCFGVKMKCCSFEVSLRQKFIHAMCFRQSLRLLLLVLLLHCVCGFADAAPASKSHTVPGSSKSAEQTYTIPFEYDSVLMPYIVVRASINGQPPLPFVVDTGAYGAALFIEPWAADKLGLPRLAALKDMNVPGQGLKTFTGTLLKSFQIVGSRKDGDFRITTNTITAANLEKFKAASPFQIVDVTGFTRDSYLGPQPAGIIPAVIFSLPGEICQIDFQHKLLRLSLKTKNWQPPVGSVAVSLYQDASTNGFYKFAVTLPIGKTMDFSLDTGNPTNSVSNLAALPLPNAQSAQSVWTKGDRKGSYDEVLLPQLRVGDLAEPNVALWEIDPVLATGSADILGLDFFSRFLVTLDLFDHKMYLKRRTDYARQIVPNGRTEVRLEKQESQYQAAWVQPGSPAAEAGLHTGDMVEQVDGQVLSSIPLYAAQNLLDGYEGTTAALAVRGSSKESHLHFVRSAKFIGRRHALLGVSSEWVQNNLLASSVTPGSPLDGTLKFDDDIYFISGEPVAKMTLDEALDKLTRPDLDLQVWRGSDKTWQEVHIAPLPNQTQVIVGLPPVGCRYFFYDRAGWTAVPR